jgi:hypothetical protein
MSLGTVWKVGSWKEGVWKEGTWADAIDAWKKVAWYSEIPVLGTANGLTLIASVLSLSAATNATPGAATAAHITALEAATGLQHTRSHSIIDSLDHTSTATSNRMLKADTNGLPVNATNTNAEVASAVTLKHAAVTTTAPVYVVGQLVSLINNAETPAGITAFDIGTLANTDTVVPTSKAVTSAIKVHADLTTTAHGLGASAFHADAYLRE